MNIEFHYYITWYLAQEAGFSPGAANIIAHASQLTDKNSTIYTINKDRPGQYINALSQSMNILMPRRALLNIYLSFHFIPGGNSAEDPKRKDRKGHRLNTIPDNSNSRLLLESALETGNLYRIGIAVHAYADTWSHQNFTGDLDPFNDHDGNLVTSITPPMGHAKVLKKPDMVGLIWEDSRLTEEEKIINNNGRIIEASEQIFKKLKKYISPGINTKELEYCWQKTRKTVLNSMGPAYTRKDLYRQERLSAYKKLIKGFIEYNTQAWFDEAVDTEIIGLKDRQSRIGTISLLKDMYYSKNGFENSHWYNFQEAVKEHRRMAINLFSPLLKKKELIGSERNR